MLFLALICKQVLGSTTTYCGPENGGNDGYSGTVEIIANNGWYFGIADLSSPPPVFFFTYNHPNNDPFIFTLVDAFCPGDRYSINIVTPLGNQIGTGTFGGALTPSCASPVNTDNPNLAIIDSANYAFRSVLIEPSLFGNLVGTWKFELFSQFLCSSDSPLSTVGLYGKIDSAVLTKTVCAFSSSSITTQPQATNLLVKMQATEGTAPTVTTMVKPPFYFVTLNSTTVRVDRWGYH